MTRFIATFALFQCSGTEPAVYERYAYCMNGAHQEVGKKIALREGDCRIREKICGSYFLNV